MEDILELPICPYCKTEMKPVRFVGYYDEFDYWECGCDNLQTKNIHRGSYA